MIFCIAVRHIAPGIIRPLGSFRQGHPEAVLTIAAEEESPMQAVLCKTYGPPESLVIEEVEPLQPGKGQVVLSVKACGVNFPDTLIIQGQYQFKPPMPFSPGGEVAGVVKAVGDGVEGVHIGDRVIASTGWGGFAEEVLTDTTRLVHARWR